MSVITGYMPIHGAGRLFILCSRFYCHGQEAPERKGKRPGWIL